MRSALMQRPILYPVKVRQAKPSWMLDPSLVLYLPLWNLNGDVFLSQDAYGHTVTRYGATPTGQGGWSFDGIDDYLDCGNAESLNLTGSLTVLLWMKFLTTELGGVVDKTYTAGGFMVWQETPTLTLFVNGGSYATVPTPAVNEWHHITAVIDSAFTRFYIDGVPQTAGAGVVPTGNTNPLVIGKDDPLERFPNLVIGEVSIYNRALTEQEIRNLYHESRGRYGG